MFIELTDHLRCPVGHEEAYLVLLPDRVTGRDVVAGHLGCPVCGWSVDFSDGAVDFGGGVASNVETALSPDAVQVFLGLGGPGGYAALVGGATRVLSAGLDPLPGVRLVAVNPPPDFATDNPASVLRGATLPLKTSSMRGVVLGRDVSSDTRWVREAVRVVLPGLRVVGEGSAPDLQELELLAAGGGAWVGRKSHSH
jgi:hypothetical protein